MTDFKVKDLGTLRVGTFKEEVLDDSGQPIKEHVLADPLTQLFLNADKIESVIAKIYDEIIIVSMCDGLRALHAPKKKRSRKNRRKRCAKKNPHAKGEKKCTKK